jgi:hypothetical protein
VKAVFRIIIWIGALAAAAHGGELNPAAVAFKLPDQIEWKSPSTNAGVQQSILVGDPTKPGLYMVADQVVARAHEPAALSSQ